MDLPHSIVFVYVAVVGPYGDLDLGEGWIRALQFKGVEDDAGDGFRLSIQDGLRALSSVYGMAWSFQMPRHERRKSSKVD